MLTQIAQHHTLGKAAVLQTGGGGKLYPDDPVIKPGDAVNQPALNRKTTAAISAIGRGKLAGEGENALDLQPAKLVAADGRPLFLPQPM